MNQGLGSIKLTAALGLSTPGGGCAQAHTSGRSGAILEPRAKLGLEYLNPDQKSSS
jgi:hypothetical protein